MSDSKLTNISNKYNNLNEELSLGAKELDINNNKKKNKDKRKRVGFREQIENFNNGEDEYVYVEVPKRKTNKRWTKALAERLRQIAYQSAGYSWMHGSDASYYNSWNGFINLWVAILSAISAVGISAFTALVENVTNKHLRRFAYSLAIIGIIFNLVVAIMSAIKLAKRYEWKIAEHSEKSAKFGDQQRKITNQFSLQPWDRQDAVDLLDTETDRFNELDREKPFFRGSTEKAWQDYYSTLKSNHTDYNSILPLPTEMQNDTMVITKDNQGNNDTIIDINNKKSGFNIFGSSESRVKSHFGTAI